MERSDFQKELEHFDEILGIIRRKLEKLYSEKAPLQERLLRERKEMWEDNRHLIRDFDDVIFLNTQETIVKSVEQQLAWNEADIQRHTKMEKSPYFGRVDFAEGETGEEDTIYIGTYSLTEAESQEIYVVDWRAPISSMFYQFDPGPAWFQVNGHKNEVEITGKRQYRIEEGRLLAVYDTDSSMYDDILGAALSEYSDHKLKVIVGSIQREQNGAIRSDTKASCLVYGLAGSGKTSIGLHRLAYVLYCNRDTIKSENILILSNNSIFGSYISAILPDLGERPAKQKVFADILEAFLEEGLEAEDYYSQLKALEGPFADGRRRWIQVKYSADMIGYCREYFASFPFQIPEIRYGEEVLVSPELLRNRLDAGHYQTFQSRLERLEHLARKAIEDFFLLHREEIRNGIADSMAEQNEPLSEKEVNIRYKKDRQECIQAALEQIRSLNSVDSREQMPKAFAGFLHGTGMWDGEAEREAERMARSLERGKLLYEDALLYLFVRELMGEVAPFLDIYHTVIDESQDYSLLQLHIVKYLFPKSSFTLLGDICQTVNSVTTIQRYEDYGQVFGDNLVRIRLSRCYRSSSQINGLAFRLIGEANRPEGYSYFDRPVKKPRYVICRDMFSCLAPILEGLEQYRSLAVIVDSEEDALAVKSRLGGEAQLILSPDDELRGRLVVIPLLLAKGLEFDAVILFNCIRSNAGNAHMRRKVYLGCTRALHELYFVEGEGLPEELRECEGYMEIVDDK